MTVITFARQRSVSTAFGGKKVSARRTPVAYRRSNVFLSIMWLIAIVGASAIMTVVVLGTYSNFLAIALSKGGTEASQLEQEVERLRVQTMALSSPQAIMEQARALGLVENTQVVQFVNIGLTSELAAK